MHTLFVLLALALVVRSDRVLMTPASDPTPWGGAPCTDSGDCNDQTCNGDLRCECDVQWGGPDCTYARYDAELIGGLQFLVFAGVGGVGNFICQRTGYAIGQLILSSTWIFVCFTTCIAACCSLAGDAGKIAAAPLTVFSCFFCCAGLAGFVWSLVDAGYFLNGYLADGYGYALYNWI